MQTITTKYMPATTHKGARVKASNTAGAHTVTLSWDYEFNSDGNHTRAAAALAAKLDWGGEWVGGCLNARGNVYVLVTGADRFQITNKREG